MDSTDFDEMSWVSWMAASAEKLGSAADRLAEATRQAAQRQHAPATITPAEEHTVGPDLPDFAAPPRIASRL